MFDQPTHCVLKTIEHNVETGIQKLFLFELSDDKMIDFISKDRDCLAYATVSIVAKLDRNGNLEPISFENIKPIMGKIRVTSIVTRKKLQQVYGALISRSKLK